MKHYVILCDWAVNDAEGVSITAVAHTFEEAKKIFAKAVIDEKKYAEENGWEVFEDTDTVFDAGESGFYAAEHAHFYIQEVDSYEYTETNDEDYTPSAENGDYSPSNPWDAPGMKLSDFI